MEIDNAYVSIPHISRTADGLFFRLWKPRERRSTDRDGYGKDGLDTEIYHDGAIYHVRQHDRRSEATKFRVFWSSFRTLAESRNVFNRQHGKLTHSSS